MESLFRIENMGIHEWLVLLQYILFKEYEKYEKYSEQEHEHSRVAGATTQ